MNEKTQRGKTVEISEESRRKLRKLAADTDKKIYELSEEAVELLFKKYESHK